MFFLWHVLYKEEDKVVYQFIYFFIEIDEIDEISHIREISLMGSFYTLFFRIKISK